MPSRTPSCPRTSSARRGKKRTYSEYLGPQRKSSPRLRERRKKNAEIARAHRQAHRSLKILMEEDNKSIKRKDAKKLLGRGIGKFVRSAKKVAERTKIIEPKLSAMTDEIRLALELLKHSIPGWKTLWEKLAHDADDGFCGTMDNDSLVRVLSLVKYTISEVCMLPESAFSAVECGCGVLCFAKAIRIALPQVHLFGFEYKNYFNSVFSDLTQLAAAVRALNEKVSIHSGILLKSIGNFEYNFGIGFSEALSMRNFLKDNGASKAVYSSQNMVLFAFWEGWSRRAKRGLAHCCSKSSEVKIIFTGDRSKKSDKNTFPTEEKLKFLNGTKRAWINEFVLFRKIPVHLASKKGKETFDGCIFVRRSLFVRKYSVLKVVRSPLPPSADLDLCKWMVLWEPSSSISLNIALQAVSHDICMSSSWIYSGMPSRWHVMAHTHQFDEEQLCAYVERCIVKYLTSSWFVSGGCETVQGILKLRSSVSGLSYEEKARGAVRIAKLAMFPTSPKGITEEVKSHITKQSRNIAQSKVYRDMFAPKIPKFRCTICCTTGTKEDILAHAVNQDCRGNYDNIQLASADSCDLEFDESSTELLKDMFVNFSATLSAKDQHLFVGEKGKENVIRECVAKMEDALKNYTESKRQVELLNRWRAHVTKRQQNILNRTKKRLVETRFVNDTIEIEIGEVLFPVKISSLETRWDGETARKMLDDFGIRDCLCQIPGLRFDHGFVKKCGKIIEKRIDMLFRHKFRKLLWRKHDGLYIDIHVDGAPRTQRGLQKDQFVVVLRLLNENVALERSMLIPVVIANVKETSAEARQICKIIGKSLLEFQKGVRKDGLGLTGHKDVKFVAASDLKALNMLFGFTEYTGIFPYPSKIFSSRENSGWGKVYGRNSDTPFKNFEARKLSVDEFKAEFEARRSKIGKKLEEELNTARARPSQRRRRSKGSASSKKKLKRSKAAAIAMLAETDLPQPVQMKPEILLYLRGELQKIPEDERRDWAKYCGLGIVDPCPMFGELLWDKLALCALHYKTTKVLDILNLCTHTLAAYDEILGHSIADTDKLGKSCKFFLETISSSPKFRGKLMVYAEKTETLILKTASEASFRALNNESTKKLEAYLKGDELCSRRLIGEQANVVLSFVEDLLEVLIEARNQSSSKATGKFEKGLTATISGLYCVLNYSRDIVYIMSLSCHPQNESEPRRKKRLQKIAKRYRRTAAKLEYVQQFVFPEWFRPYDLTVSCCGPDIMDDLVSDGFLMGEVGLLEVFEAYHQFVKSLPVMKFYSKTDTQESACMAKLIKTLLTNIYAEDVDPLPLKEERKPYIHPKSGKLTKSRKESHIKVIHEYDGIGCVCGRKVANEDCAYCSYGVVSELDDLVSKCADYLLCGTYSDADVKSVHKSRKKLVQFTFTKGLGVSKHRK
jgi:hypothetical protein